MKIFIIAILIRLTIFVGLSLAFKGQNVSTFAGDPLEYYLNAQNLSKSDQYHAEWEYTYWWERSPLYVLFLWFFTPNVALYIQIFISSLGVYWMWKINTRAGWIWNLYECWYPILFLKESIVFAMMIFIVYKFIEAPSMRIKHGNQM
jgi:hypothetical protein